jgi:hypothetical protein
VNDTVSSTTAGVRRLRVRARRGENVLEARLLSEASGAGRWRFDFAGASGFVTGSLRVEAGEVLAVDAHSVTFRVTGKPGPFVRVRFRARD